jgi:hypothetical protein
MIDALEIELQARIFATGHGIEIAHLLEACATLADAAIRDHDVIKRLVFGAAARQTNCDHMSCSVRPKKSADSTQNGRPMKGLRNPANFLAPG